MSSEAEFDERAQIILSCRSKENKVCSLLRQSALSLFSAVQSRDVQSARILSIMTSKEHLVPISPYLVLTSASYRDAVSD